ncbi:MAG: cation:proton antiporter subunit C [Bacillota bacterium]
MDVLSLGPWVGLALFLIGLYGLLTSREMTRIVMNLTVAESGVIFALVARAGSGGQGAPIVGNAAGSMVAPLPHALVLTAIVIGASLTALGLSLAQGTHELERNAGSGEEQ